MPNKQKIDFGLACQSIKLSEAFLDRQYIFSDLNFVFNFPVKSFLMQFQDNF